MIRLSPMELQVLRTLLERRGNEVMATLLATSSYDTSVVFANELLSELRDPTLWREFLAACRESGVGPQARRGGK